MTGRLDSEGLVHIVADRLRTSLWFIPSLMMLAAAFLSMGVLWVDRGLQGRAGDAPWWLYVSSRDDAQGVLSTLLTSMITMTSLVFSITMV